MELNEQLILLPTNELLEKFGGGNHVPGSGSAVALSGIIACKLCFTVISLTKSRAGYETVESRIEFISAQLLKLEPNLYDAFQRDSEVFNDVVLLRQKRDETTDPKLRKGYADDELEKLKIATEIQLEVCGVCHDICQNAMYLFDIAFKSARGDSGAAASSAVSAAYAALFICYLNLKKFREGQWATEARRKCEDLLRRTNQLQAELFSRVVTLRDEGPPLESAQLELNLNIDELANE
jgi:methenyltetrahydrofolate cyclohydrolase